MVERIQSAILACGASPCEVFIPAGTYHSSPVSTWNSRGPGGARLGILLPSNVELRGAGQGHTVIRVTRSANDPPAALLGNANELNRNIHIHDLSVEWNDSSQTYNWVSIFTCHGCEQVELDHLTLQGNPNKLVNLLDCTGSSIHDNNFLLRSTGYGHGDSALSFNHFDVGISLGLVGGVARDNTFREIGDYRTFSMLIVTQSGVSVHSNTFIAELPPPGNATGIESGQDNLGRLPEDVTISGNKFYGSSIAYGGLNSSEISGNFFDNGDIYVALQSGSVSSMTELAIVNNELHHGSISLGGLEHTFVGRCIIDNNRVYDGNIRTGSLLVNGDIEVDYNTVKYSSNSNGIDCNACSIVRGNLVQDVGQNGPADLHAGYLINGSAIEVSGNTYIDDQQEYSAGTVCSVASPAATTCLPSGPSRWVRVQGGEWGFGWGNRTLFTTRGNYPIRSFVNNNVLEVDKAVDSLPVGTTYHLSRTTFNAYELDGVTIERFANNVAIATTGAFNHAAVQEDGAVVIKDLSGNSFRPYKCFGKCVNHYEAQ